MASRHGWAYIAALAGDGPGPEQAAAASMNRSKRASSAQKWGSSRAYSSEAGERQMSPKYRPRGVPWDVHPLSQLDAPAR